MPSPFAIFLCSFYLATKLLVRWWWFRPVYRRPGFIRHNESLRMYDLIAVLALIALFFVLVNSYNLLRTLALTGGLLAYDLMLRAIFLHLEAKRVCATSPKWKYREARRRVRRRVRSSTAL